MSIYIKNTDGSFTLASDSDLEVRGYVSTQQLDPIPQMEDGEVRLTITDFNRDHKVKTIKSIRNTINTFYGKETFRDQPTTFKVTPPTQSSTDYDDSLFGLKHIKHFVDGSCSITIHTDCYSQVVSDLGTAWKCTFEYEFTKGSNNLERLQDHRAKLKEELRKIDDLIAYQLYS
tara:strand:+ start:1890 stop:2411 length:522 start_codon:yes stop_codon:yes gene_type:complete